MDCKLASAIEGLKSELRYENGKLAESLIARLESANAAIREEFNAKISSEIRVVSDKLDDVSRDTENKMTALHNAIKSVHECMNERMNAHVVQARKETDRQGQEITAASSSLLASIREHKEHVGVTIENLSDEISKSKEYVDSRPPPWSSGQSFWLQIQRSRVRFPALPDFLSSSGSGTGYTQPREVN